MPGTESRTSSYQGVAFTMAAVALLPVLVSGLVDQVPTALAAVYWIVALVTLTALSFRIATIDRRIDENNGRQP